MAELLSADQVATAAEALATGRLVAFPTETVYGLGADACNADAVAGVFAAKGRPSGHPLIVHVAGVGDLDRFGRSVTPMARKLGAAFWPGPLTVVVERSDEVAPETTGGLNTVGLRVPDHPVALALLEAFGGGVAGPSANRFGSVSPTTAAHVLDDLGPAIDYVLDGGPCRVGVESTIVDATGSSPVLLRPGGISAIEIESVLGAAVVDGRSGPTRAPGMMASHYAPKVAVELVDETDLDRACSDAQSAGLSIGVIRPEPAPASSCSSQAQSARSGATWLLPAEADGYAAALYRTFREADRHGLDRLLVVPPRSGSLLDAVLDRLQKAAGPKR